MCPKPLCRDDPRHRQPHPQHGAESAADTRCRNHQEPESGSAPSRQRGLCSQEGRGFRGDMFKQLARDSNDVPPSTVSGLATALGVVQSPCAPATMVSGVMERGRGDPMALPSPAGFTPSCSSAPGSAGARDVPHAASPAPGASGPGSTTAPRVQDAATSPHIPAPLPGTAPVRCWDGNSLPPVRCWAGVSWPLSGVAKPGSRTGRNDGEHLQTPHC